MIARRALFVLLTGIALSASAGNTPANFLYVGSGELQGVTHLLERPDIAGVQVVYNWRDLETARDRYDFSLIEHDLQLSDALHKKLFIQIQDRFFTPQARNVPDYLMQDPVYRGGIIGQMDNPGENRPRVSGWVAQQWVPAVRLRYQRLLTALAARFDGRIYGINLPETAIDIDMKHNKTGFSCDGYFDAEMDNLRAARAAFKQSRVVQYVNFWPCEWDNDHQYMSRLFAYAADNNVGLGGPDIVPYKKGQMKNAYPFFNRYKGKLPLVAMAVQEATLTYTNPQRHKPFTREEFVRFGSDYLGADIIFWSVSTPWLAGKSDQNGR